MLTSLFLHLQLPEPIMPFHMYNRLMGLAKESLRSEGDTPEGEEAESGGSLPTVSRGSELVDMGSETEPEVLVLVDSLKELIKELPKANLATLRYIIRHLRRLYRNGKSLKHLPLVICCIHSSVFCLHFRIAELEEDNKMSPSNLGIVFGPSLMRPRPTGATISLSSLVDYPHQARIVEAFIVFYSSIFQSKTSQSNKTSRSASSTSQKVRLWICHCVSILKCKHETLSCSIQSYKLYLNSHMEKKKKGRSPQRLAL